MLFALSLPACCSELSGYRELAGFTTAYSSANGGINFSVGFLAAIPVTSIFLIWGFVHFDKSRMGKATHGRWRSVAPVVVSLVIVTLLSLGPYRDDRILRLDTTIAHGPYAGLRTTEEKASFVAKLEDDLKALTSSCGIVFFADFPAGYLLSSAMPHTNSAWIAQQYVAEKNIPPYRNQLMKYYARHGLPEIVVEMLYIPFSTKDGFRQQDDRADPLGRLVGLNGTASRPRVRNTACTGGRVPRARADEAAVEPTAGEPGDKREDGQIWISVPSHR